MLASITPLGERGRQRDWAPTAVAYAIGSVAGGGATGALAGALGAVLATWLERPAAWILFVALVVAALFEIGAMPLPLPTIRRQVNEDWLDEYRGWVVGLGFGFQLGAAFTTIVTSASVYVTFVAAVLTGSVAGGVIVGVAFGVARALPVLAVRRVETPQALAAVHRRMDALAGTAHVVVAGAATFLAVAALFLGSIGGSS
jgi:MFS family permease